MRDLGDLGDDEVFVEETFSGALGNKALKAMEFDACTFTGASMLEGRLFGAMFTECRFVDCDLSLADLTNTSFVSCTFERSKFVGVAWGKLGASGLGQPYFTECKLDLSSFQRATAERWVFERCSLTDVDFSQTTMMRTRFTDCDLTGARFADTDLRDVNLKGSYGYGIDLTSCRTKGVRLTPDDDALALLRQFGIQFD
ncbi:pentapeptide repeat-containing protein [Tessaracoccus sp. MC1756]|uniref:pentapeptide repeat-containing protein n=1 Tax=Tessaracoccus sp. MC1756 TaxID=2760311 RepID=UPI0015FFD45B|nr:pentapeptide repeat-containing protein [Tessaracoccus sp. MC1756]MBB1510203.1 pentapeptide repeat-containing protein [Tessaracoccus sp. MC1756]